MERWLRPTSRRPESLPRPALAVSVEAIVSRTGPPRISPTSVLAIKVSYAGWTSKPVRVVVDAVDPERPFRFLELRPFRVRRRARRSRKDTIRPAIRSASPGWTSAR
jgi:hypothetical protein